MKSAIHAALLGLAVSTAPVCAVFAQDTTKAETTAETEAATGQDTQPAAQAAPGAMAPGKAGSDKAGSDKAAPDTVVAKVGDVEITAGDLDQALEDMAPQFASFPEDQRRARALDSLIDINVLARQAEEKGLDKDEKTKRRMELLRNRALHNGYFETIVRPSVTDAELKARYEKEVGAATPEQEVSARHILVKTQEEAEAIIEELEAGADFAELAKSKSTGPSGPNGGDLGYFSKGRMVPEFEEAAFAMEKGDYTKKPVKTQFGFHVIKVEDKRDVALPTFEQSKEQLRHIVLTEKYADAVKQGRQAVGVEIMDESLVLPTTETADTDPSASDQAESGQSASDPSASGKEQPEQTNPANN